MTPKEYAKKYWVGESALAGYFPKISEGSCKCCGAYGTRFASLCKHCYEKACKV
jgi:hypothetical protein